ncbi:MAG TPA: glycoside hydrolase family 76 protein, partial [Mariniphaga sp.]|nr:glycoside hydrolase family 76 protein [Mariniphaga sp.]
MTCRNNKIGKKGIHQGRFGFVFSLIFFVLSFTRCNNTPNKIEVERADDTLESILKYYDAEYNHLFNETYPYQETNKVTYLADTDTLQGKRVAYLWPTSGIFSGVNALLKSIKDQKYVEILDEVIVPGLENYYDEERVPASYQSYIIQAGPSDRFYDDNIWLALDFLEAYQLTSKGEYLQRSLQLWEFVLSGWDENLGGGIYWCEQKRKTKNTCSNAPASVLALKLFEATGDSSYFKWGKSIYTWTRENLQDPEDQLYFDNISLAGRVDERKYTYNSGQMLQASVLLYRLTEEEVYLVDAQKIAKSAISQFTEEFETPEGEKIQLFKNTGNWFNVILFRGYVELYEIDGDRQYIEIFRDNLNHVWNHVRNSKGLF